jgi:hypothetical protein
MSNCPSAAAALTAGLYTFDVQFVDSIIRAIGNPSGAVAFGPRGEIAVYGLGGARRRPRTCRLAIGSRRVTQDRGLSGLESVVHLTVTAVTVAGEISAYSEDFWMGCAGGQPVTGRGRGRGRVRVDFRGIRWSRMFLIWKRVMGGCFGRGEVRLVPRIPKPVTPSGVRASRITNFRILVRVCILRDPGGQFFVFLGRQHPLTLLGGRLRLRFNPKRTC